jgi:hypothetical protein
VESDEATFGRLRRTDRAETMGRDIAPGRVLVSGPLSGSISEAFYESLVFFFEETQRLEAFSRALK